MPRSFNNLKTRVLPANFSAVSFSKDPRYLARLVLGILLLANLIAAYAIFQPLGGSAEELDAQLRDKQTQLAREQIQLGRMRALVAKIETARTSGDAFIDQYFIGRRTLSSTIVSELQKAAKDAGIKRSQHSFTIDPIEGTDTMSMVTVVGVYEGTYGDLLQFVNRLDKSGRFMIIDTMSAAPMQGTGNLAINIKLHTFVREDGSTA